MNKKILIVAAHPDDEVLGAGGIIQKYVKNNDKVYCLILGQGEMSRLDSSEGKLAALKQQAYTSAKILGMEDIFLLNFPDQKFDCVDFLSIRRKVEEYIEKIQPDIIYTHYENDLNQDHNITFRAVIEACKPQRQGLPKEIYSFEVLSSTEWQLSGNKFKPNIYVDIENEIKGKINALQAYTSELRDYPHPRSEEGIKILAKYRGLECGKKYVEAFYLVRSIKNGI